MSKCGTLQDYLKWVEENQEGRRHTTCRVQSAPTEEMDVATLGIGRRNTQFRFEAGQVLRRFAPNTVKVARIEMPRIISSENAAKIQVEWEE